jgi:methylthioribose-1-phosphate isomerase
VLATESRPLLQGSRLTAWELGAAGVDVRLIVDSAAGAAMAGGLVEAVVLGCDRVAANGDTANKIGTYSLAVLARQHGIPFYVAGPLSTFDLDTADGSAIVVEERSADEVRRFAGQPSAPPDVQVWNPAFDVTPAELITAFVTEAGVLEPPYADSITRAVRKGSVLADPAVVRGSEAWTTELPGDSHAVVAGTGVDR